MAGDVEGCFDIDRIDVIAERPIAIKSPDHIMPWGTRRDTSINRRFNEKLYRLFESIDPDGLRVLDLGCSGGSFVKTCLDDGCLAVGLEGSDYSKRCKRAEWASIPGNLFTCDVTGHFEVRAVRGSESELLKFQVVTAWELIEHINEEDLECVARNVERHLLPSGLWIMSVSPNEEVINGMRLHQTVKPRYWWIQKFESLGFVHLETFVDYFDSQFVRGEKYGAPGSFHLVLSRDPSLAPSLPASRLGERLYDRWLGSRCQRILKRIVVGP